MINNINLDSFKVFYEVAKHQNITNASKTLFISQPAITQTINKLEKQLDTILLIRHHKGVSLTPIGQKIYNEVAQTILNYKAIESIVLEEKQLISGKINISTGTIFANEILLPYLEKFMKKHPQINVNIFDTIFIDKIEKLISGDIDIAIAQQGTVHSPVIEFKPFMTSEYIFIASPMLKNKPTNIDSLQNHIFITQPQNTSARSEFDKFITKNNITPKQIHEVSGYNLIKKLVESNIGIAFVPKYIVEESITNNTLIEVDLNITLPTLQYGFYLNNKNISPTTKAFIDVMYSNN